MIMLMYDEVPPMGMLIPLIEAKPLLMSETWSRQNGWLKINHTIEASGFSLDRRGQLLSTPLLAESLNDFKLLVFGGDGTSNNIGRETDQARPCRFTNGFSTNSGD
jgi:hypothetical protein